jgi:hypothetical protein
MAMTIVKSSQSGSITMDIIEDKNKYQLSLTIVSATGGFYVKQLSNTTIDMISLMIREYKALQEKG